MGASPPLNGNEDGNSVHGNVQPWLRSLDGLNTHDDAYKLAMAGGVTTSLILPGSANSMGMLRILNTDTAIYSIVFQAAKLSQ